MSKKPIIVFEGIEGSGKTTHIKYVSKLLKKMLIAIAKQRGIKPKKKKETISLVIYSSVLDS